MSVFVAKEQDGFICSQLESNSRWIVTLSNGETIYQDDDRPNVEPNSAWLRLAIYVRENNLKIRDMKLQFRTHIEPIGREADGYFFSKMLRGEWGSDKSQYFYLAGTVSDGLIQLRKWRIPDLLAISDEVRRVEDAGECLIMNE